MRVEFFIDHSATLFPDSVDKYPFWQKYTHLREK